MKLEVGMYARLYGKIGKIVKICTCEQCEARGYYEPIIEYAHNERDYVTGYWKDNLKVSHNIIDLIEVGDYVNGERVCAIEKYEEGKLTVLALFEDYCTQQNIKSIVTKEQFESISYEVSK